ncbi:MAG: cyd operon YbgE family protein [Psychromonas sp.]|nr:cyd operon YbgE family protein [Psychromonas sp.]
MKLNDYMERLHKPFQNRFARSFSLLLALALSGLLLINPRHIADNTAQLNHGYLSVLMLALSAVFIHGIGFKPIFWLWKIVFSPYWSWPVLVTFVVLMFV